jgi:Helix-turn-helix domain
MSISSLSTVLQSSQARRSARMVLMILAHHTNAGGYAWPSVPTIAREVQLSVRTVQYHLRKLERMGELKMLVAAGPKGCNLYQVMPNLSHDEPDEPRCNFAESPVNPGAIMLMTPAPTGATIPADECTTERTDIVPTPEKLSRWLTRGSLAWQILTGSEATHQLLT